MFRMFCICIQQIKQKNKNIVSTIKEGCV